MATNRRLNSKVERKPNAANYHRPSHVVQEAWERNVCKAPTHRVTSVKNGIIPMITEHKSEQAAKREFDKRERSRRHSNVQLFDLTGG